MDNNNIISNFTSQDKYHILKKRKSKNGREFIYPSIQQKKEEIIRNLNSNTNNSMENTT